jgi:hypothetical protein
MTYEELCKAINLDNLFNDHGFTIEPYYNGLIILRADTKHEKQKAFQFCEENTLRIFDTIEEAAAFVHGWNECKSMMKLSGQLK